MYDLPANGILAVIHQSGPSPGSISRSYLSSCDLQLSFGVFCSLDAHRVLESTGKGAWWGIHKRAGGSGLKQQPETFRIIFARRRRFIIVET
jgi:hypothetical protein